VHRIQEPFKEQQALGRDANSTADHDAIVGGGRELALEHFSRGFVGAHQAEIGMPPAVSHLLHSNGDSGMDPCSVESWRQCRVREVDRLRLLAHEQDCASPLSLVHYVLLIREGQQLADSDYRANSGFAAWSLVGSATLAKETSQQAPDLKTQDREREDNGKSEHQRFTEKEHQEADDSERPPDLVRVADGFNHSPQYLAQRQYHDRDRRALRVACCGPSLDHLDELASRKDISCSAARKQTVATGSNRGRHASSEVAAWPLDRSPRGV
jgi:hypothetical protein